MDLREMGCDGVDWTDMAQDRHQRRAIVSAGKFLSDCPINGSLRKAQLRE
jgi:hypothetical protein